MVLPVRIGKEKMMAENSSPTAFFRQIISDEIENGNLVLEELDHKKAKVLKDIMECHTPAKGIAMSFCPHCGHSEYHNGSCHNACCPCCGSSVRLKWIEKQQDYVLDARYFHIVFTIPSELNPLCLYDPEFMYNCLFDSVGQTLLAFSDDQKFLGGMPGFYCALHTWGQKLDLHPHIHVIFCAGALTDSGEWVTPKRTTKDGRPFLFPVKALAAKFRGEFMARLNEHFLSDEVFDKRELNSIIHKSLNKKWNVEIRESTGDPSHVIEYLGRYVNRVAITESRIVSYENGIVTFKYKDYRDGNKIKTMELTAQEFLRRFMMHIPPRYFTTKRGYGFLSSGRKGSLVPRLKELIKETKLKSGSRSDKPVTIADVTPKERNPLFKVLDKMFPKQSIGRCKKCGELMEYISSWECIRLFGPPRAVYP